MCDVRVFLTFTFVVKIFQGTRVFDGDGSRQMFHPPPWI